MAQLMQAILYIIIIYIIGHGYSVSTQKILPS
jgi:hypothetical protein